MKTSTAKSLSQPRITERRLVSRLRRSLHKTKSRKNRRGVTRTVLLAVNLIALAVVGGFVLLNNGNHKPAAQLPAETDNGATFNPIDEVSAADIAETVSHLTNLPETTAVHNQADTADLQINEAITSNNIVSKPNVITSTIKSKADIQKYTAQSGDTVTSLATKFSVTSDSIRWSNNLSGDSVPVGKVLFISPTSDGIVHQVQDGDTPESLAKKFRANRDQIIAFNDAELKGLIVNDLIVIPGGSILFSSSAAAAINDFGGGFAWGGNNAVYGSNGYDYGQCTYWAALRREQTGDPIPANLGNAITWVSLARKAGLTTGNTPRKGAVIWTPPSMLSGYYAAYGHVGFVEDVLPDGTAKVSDMNKIGWNKVSSRTLSPLEAKAFTYIY